MKLSYIKDMKEYCNKNISCENCNYRIACVNWLNSGENRYTPSKSEIKEMFKFLNIKKGKQKFIIKEYEINLKDEAYMYYKKLIREYCIKRGYIMNKDWLKFHNFKLYFDYQKTVGKNKPRLKQNSYIIDETTLLFK